MTTSSDKEHPIQAHMAHIKPDPAIDHFTIGTRTVRDERSDSANQPYTAPHGYREQFI
jgi:hypothetical protein